MGAAEGLDLVGAPGRGVVLHVVASDPDGDEGNGRDAHMVGYARVIVTVRDPSGA